MAKMSQLGSLGKHGLYTQEEQLLWPASEVWAVTPTFGGILRYLTSCYYRWP